MKQVTVSLLAGVLALGVSQARAEEKAKAAADDLKSLDAKMTEAFKNHDVKELEKHAADGLLVIDPLGRVHNKKQYFEHLEKTTMKIEDLKETDVKTRIFGDTGIVTGLLSLKAMVGEKDISGDYRWTRVYNKKGGEWQVVSEQHTYVQPKETK